MNKENKNELNNELENYFEKIKLLKIKRNREYYNFDDNNNNINNNIFIESDIKIINKNKINNDKNNNFLNNQNNNEIIIKKFKNKS